MLYFCTLFDANYLSRGLVTYESLMSATEGKARLFVFAFDDRCHAILTAMNLPNLTVISLAEFEDAELLAVKPTRSRAEYCWTATSSTIRFCLQKFGLSHCTYIDADMVFYENPQILIAEKPAAASVIITEHRYTPQYDKSKLSGKYCVQFMYFENTSDGLEVLNWWRDRCLEWCFNRHENGKFGDQKYLDDWLERFSSAVYSLQYLGGGVAPWNVLQYQFEKTNDKILGFVKDSYSTTSANQNWLFANGGKPFSVVFFHFHGVKLYQNGKAIFAPKQYILTADVRRIFYENYLEKLVAAAAKARAYAPDFDVNATLPTPQYRRDVRRGWGAFFKTNVVNRFLKTRF